MTTPLNVIKNVTIAASRSDSLCKAVAKAAPNGPHQSQAGNRSDELLGKCREHGHDAGTNQAQDNVQNPTRHRGGIAPCLVRMSFWAHTHGRSDRTQVQ